MKFVTLAVLSALSVAASADTAPEFVGRQAQAEVCAADGERAQECTGIENPDRPEKCCEDLFCVGARCASAVAECAPQGEKAIECGIAQVNRPEECCEGLVCDALKTCQPIGEVPTAEPTVFIPPTVACAAAGDRAQDCGATNTNRPQSCCEGFVCVEGAGVICIDPNAVEVEPTVEEADAEAPAEPTAAPTEAVVMEPTMGAGTVEPSPDLALDEPTSVPGTDEPTTSAVTEPTAASVVPPLPPKETMEPTDVAMVEEPTAEPTMPPAEDVTTAEPTMGEPDPTSSAPGKMVVGTALAAVALAAPLIL